MLFPKTESVSRGQYTSEGILQKLPRSVTVISCSRFNTSQNDQRKRRLCEVWTEPERPVPEEEFGWVERSWEYEWKGFKTVAAAGVLQTRSQCQNVVGKPKLSKYILKFGQIRLAIWTNTLHGKVNTVRQASCNVRGQNVRMLLARLDFADVLHCMIWQM